MEEVLLDTFVPTILEDNKIPNPSNATFSFLLMFSHSIVPILFIALILLINQGSVHSSIVQGHEQERQLLRGSSVDMNEHSRETQQTEAVCPATLPTPGSPCSVTDSTTMCGYNYVYFPTVKTTKGGGTSCRGPYTCEPTESCECVDFTWMCLAIAAIECERGIKGKAYQTCDV
jgi:hypothetical protein